MQSIKKTFTVLTTIFGVLVTSSIHSEISYIEIKGVHASIKPEKSHLSPVHGFIWWKSKQIEKLYRYGVDSDKTIQLIRKLFYLQPDNITFDTSKIPTNIASFFTAQTIGTIMRALEMVGMETDYEHAKSDLKTALKKEFDTIKKAQQYVLLKKEKDTPKKQSDTLEKEIDALKKQQKEAEAYEQKTTLYLALHSEPTAQPSEFEIKFKKHIRDLRNQIREKTQEKKVIDDKLKQINKELIQIAHEIFPPDAVDTIVDLIFNAHQESLPGKKQKYIPYTVHNILLGFLWRKSTSKQDFLDYFTAVDTDILVTTEILQKSSTEQSTWISQKYSQENLKNYEQFFQAMKTFNPEELFEQLVAYLHAYDIFNQPLPPQATGGNPTYKGITFPDCGETSLRNFFNNILYDKDTKTFEFKLLEKAFDKQNIHPNLRDFYSSQLSSVDQVNSTETLSKWAAVVSDLNVHGGTEKIVYQQSAVCEIDTGISNMLKVINRLLGVNTFNDLVNKLKDAGLNITLVDKSEENFGEIRFTIEKRGTFIWHFERNHFYITVKTKTFKSSDVEKVMNIIGNLISNPTTMKKNNELLNLIMLYKDKKDLEDSLANKLQNTFPSPYILHAYLILYNLNNHEEKVNFIEKILENKVLGDLPYNLSLDTLIIKIIDELPSDDIYRLEIVSTLIKKSNAIEKSEELLNKVITTAESIKDEYIQIRAISKLLKAKKLLITIPKLTTIIENIALKIEQDYQKNNAISKLLKAKELLKTTPQLTNLIEKIALKINYDHIKISAISKLFKEKKLLITIPKLTTIIENIATSITDDHQKMMVISKLLREDGLLKTTPQFLNLIENIAKSITNDYEKAMVISELLKKDLLITTPQLKTLISDIAKTTDPTSITPDWQKQNAIEILNEAKILINTNP